MRPKRSKRAHEPKWRQPLLARNDAQSLRGVPLSSLEPGALVYARIPYTAPDPDGADSKVRPAAVVRRAGRTIWVSTISTKSRGGTPIDLSGTGLARRSFLRLDLVELDKMDIVDLVGQIGEEEWNLLVTLFDPEDETPT